MKRKTFVIYMILYFIISSYFAHYYSLTLPFKEEKEAVKQIFELNNNEKVIMLYQKIYWLTPTLRAIYISNGKLCITETKYFQDGEYGVKIAGSIQQRDFLQLLWLINIFNLFYLGYIKNKDKKQI